MFIVINNTTPIYMHNAAAAAAAADNYTAADAAVDKLKAYTDKLKAQYADILKSR